MGTRPSSVAGVSHPGRHSTLRPVLLVHGAWAGAWVWAPVMFFLRRMGVECVAVDLPSRGQVAAALADDAAAVREALDLLGRPAVVVAHSYGGVPVTQAADKTTHAAEVVFIAAVMAEPGQSTLSTMANDPAPSAWNRFLRQTRPGRALLDPVGLRARLRRRPLPSERTMVLDAAPDRAGWRSLPSTYVVLTRDLIFSASAQRAMADRADRRVEIRGFHVAIFVQPKQIATLIAAIAADSSGSQGVI